MVLPFSALISANFVGAWMLTVPRTRPSRCTIRLGGGSSTTGAGGVFVTAAASVTTRALVTAGGSVGGAATGGVSATIAGTVEVSANVGWVLPGAYCLRYCDPRNPP